MNITLKDIPHELHERLREAAAHSGRSVNKLIIHTLECSLLPTKVDRSQLTSRIRNRRENMTVWLQDNDLGTAIREGRR